ncbi:MAG: DUF3048 domain-containing protein [Oscillospiraceae bacterium]|nr:DUF3048 domain-containing protein [Oscillospiraceae bacterium]
MKKEWLTVLLAGALALSGCRAGEEIGAFEHEVPVFAAEQTEPPYDGALSPLTGLPISDEAANRRPVAIMLNNLKQAMPQLGQSQADIIYEVLAEGGITRMLAVYQSVEDVEMIGSVRSARPYYLELALGHDAIYLHAGGSPDAYTKIRQWGVDAMDGVNGPYSGQTPESNLFWRDAARKKANGLEHSMVTTGTAIERTLAASSYRLTHADGYSYEMQFAADGTPQDGVDAAVLTVPYSYYKTGVFTYDSDAGLYWVEEYGAPYVDGNTDEQIGVTNVLVLRTACNAISGDSAGRITVDLSGSGTGYYACGGQLIDIVWSKSYPDGQLYYEDLDGNPIVFGAGRTYVNIVPTNSEVEISSGAEAPA